jgi:hypothetical protein
MNNYIDPAGFNNSLRNFQNDYCGTIGRSSPRASSPVTPSPRRAST